MTLRFTWKAIVVGSLLATVSGCGGVFGSAEPQHYAFVANLSSPSISRFLVSPSGALTSLGAETTTHGKPGNLAVTPDGKHLYTVNQGGKIDHFSIGVDGSLTPVTNTPIDLHYSCSNLAVTGDGKYLFVTVMGDDKVCQFVINKDGSLTANATPSIPTRMAPMFVALSPNGKYAYVASLYSMVEAFVINPDGTLTPNGPDMPVSLSPRQMGISKTGSNLYVACLHANRIAQVGIADDGKLTVMPSTSVPGPTFCQALAVSPVTGQVYSSSSEGTAGIKRYAVADGVPFAGGLSEITPEFTATPTGVSSMQFSSQNVLYVCNFVEKKVLVFSADANGSLTQLDSESVPGTPSAIAFATR